MEKLAKRKAATQARESKRSNVKDDEEDMSALMEMERGHQADEKDEDDDQWRYESGDEGKAEGKWESRGWEGPRKRAKP